MSTIAVVDGIKIQVYWDDHPPAHFHVEYDDYRAQVTIDGLRVINGYVPNACPEKWQPVFGTKIMHKQYVRNAL